MLFRKTEFPNTAPRLLLTLKDSEIPQLQEFIDNINLPFKNKFLELVFENFELSYAVNNLNLQLLVLMNGMEALFNKGSNGEIIYKISRNASVLLGKDKDEAVTIEKTLKELYHKRSNIVHTGKADITEEEVSKLRSYLRKSIIGFHKLNQDKDSTLNLLNSHGFGDSPIKNL